MLTYLLRRILIAVPTLLGVVLLVFLMVRLAPGDPAILLAGEFATPETLEAIRTRYGPVSYTHLTLPTIYSV